MSQGAPRDEYGSRASEVESQGAGESTDDSDSVDVENCQFFTNKRQHTYPTSHLFAASVLMLLGVSAAQASSKLQHHVHDGVSWTRRRALGK